MSGIEVLRGGVTSRNIKLETTNVSISKWQDNDGNFVCVIFTMASKGGGDTRVQLQIYPDKFDDLAVLMMTADRDIASKAMLSALIHDVNDRPNQDQLERQMGRQDIVQRAWLSTLGEHFSEPPDKYAMYKFLHELASKSWTPPEADTA